MCVGGVKVVVCSLCVLDSLFVCVVRTSPWSLLAVKMVILNCYTTQIHVLALTSYEILQEQILQSCSFYGFLFCPRSLVL